MKILLLHAYSSKNTGDGLLVELSHSLLNRAFSNPEITTVALDASSFGERDVIQWGDASVQNHKIPVPAGMFIASLIGNKNLNEIASKSDLILGVGGGYMRGGTLIEAIKYVGAHFGQLRIAARHGSRSILLPQSIGPFRGPLKQIIGSRLSKIDTIYLRDERSINDLHKLQNILRGSDLAVMELARSIEEIPEPVDNRPVIIARHLAGKNKKYGILLRDLAKDKRYGWAVQSRGRGNNDGPLTDALSESTAPNLAELLAAKKAGVIVSTRLHGSMAALLAGVPTVHLSYERKGWGAFSDLGLDRYVLNARNTTLAEVNTLVDEIQNDQTAYWKRVLAARGMISKREIELIHNLRRVAGERVHG
ncbi:polysaccharide pyruvyl transferase family protein [Paeniglutamicibacter sp. Y32M11]|uniref:polysaccharide pyruvyl transferase family protein n=1 Tax=Paeniglutamicibacter sp. Y32M11 TaxID=2853258 RepID=UPI001C5304D8|nr:polysaccharide pyruvyl transferase family protein [Paeniglutamicibacter sp. Y32M11]QXQ09639.1 polysaccharide pyruvyl transferase family protein [Paeniglutamicibacter sp. Y32M11]